MKNKQKNVKSKNKMKNKQQTGLSVIRKTG